MNDASRHHRPRLDVLAGTLTFIAFTAVAFARGLDLFWPRLMLMAGVLVIVPMGFGLVPLTRDRWWRCARTAIVPAAAALAAGQFIPTGVAGGLAVPWLIVTIVIACLGLRHLLIRRRDGIEGLTVAAAMAFLAVGGAWSVADLSGMRPLGFAQEIVLLTAVHFVYAGFALAVLTALAIPHCRGPAARGTALIVVVAVPLVATGITLTQLGHGQTFETCAAVVMGLGGMLAALLQIRTILRPRVPLPAKGLLCISASALLIGMVWAIVYGLREVATFEGLDLPFMWNVHGTVNALGFALPGMLGWSVIDRRSNRTVEISEKGV